MCQSGWKLQPMRKGLKLVCLYMIDNDESEDEEEELQPLITAWEASGQSRLTNEFDVLKLLGKGGFGDVIKVSTFVFLN